MEHMIKIHHKDKPNRVKCKFCDKTFASNWSCHRHMLSYHPGKEDSVSVRLETIKQKRVYRCPLCDKAYSAPQSLQKHKEKMHPGNTTTQLAVRSALLNVLDNIGSMSDLFKSLETFAKDGNVFAESMPEELLKKLKEDDAKVQIMLRVSAIAKVHRMVRLMDNQDKLDTEIKERLSKKKEIKSLTYDTLIKLTKIVNESVRSEMSTIQDILKLGTVDSIDLSKIISELIEPMTAGGSFALTGTILPDTTVSREKLRKAVEAMRAEIKKENNDNSKQVDNKEGKEPNKV